MPGECILSVAKREKMGYTVGTENREEKHEKETYRHFTGGNLRTYSRTHRLLRQCRNKRYG